MTNEEILQFLKEKDFFTGSKHFTKKIVKNLLQSLSVINI